MYRPSPNSLALLECLKERSLHFSELLKDRLYFGTVSEVNLNYFPKKSDSSICFVHFDKELLYQPFNHDFGPLNVAMLYRFCKKINSHLQRNKTIVHLTTTNRFKRVNAAYLVGSYCIIYHHLLPGDVISRLKEQSISYVAYKTFTPFVDAGFDTSEYYLHLEDCFNAVYKACIKQILNFDKFNLNEYLFYERVENGDLNWIIPGRFIAFCDPQTYSDSTNHFIKLYTNYFRKHNITTIIRLNKSRYDSKMFTDKGFKHYNLVFMDGGVPSDHILNEFLRITETHSGAIAVHCKAGLGRTGTLIACYLIKHYKFTALEAIAWVRICRPGSIVGYQQKWLTIKQNSLWNQMDLCADNNLDDDSGTMAVADNSHTTSAVVNNNNVNGNEQLPITIVKCHILSQSDGRSSPTMVVPSVSALFQRQQTKSITSTTTSNELAAQPTPESSTNIITHQTYQERQQSPIPEKQHDSRKHRLIKQKQQQNPDRMIICNEDFKDKDNNNNGFDDEPNDSEQMTQGDYLNQIKFNRKRQLRSRINLWFNKSSSSANKIINIQDNINPMDSMDANNNNNNETEQWQQRIFIDNNNSHQMGSAGGDLSTTDLNKQKQSQLYGSISDGGCVGGRIKKMYTIQ